jgi:hypothetical protein
MHNIKLCGLRYQNQIEPPKKLRDFVLSSGVFSDICVQTSDKNRPRVDCTAAARRVIRSKEFRRENFLIKSSAVCKCESEGMQTACYTKVANERTSKQKRGLQKTIHLHSLRSQFK